MFDRVTDCGLSVLMDPTFVGRKVNAGGTATVILSTEPAYSER
jgi:hypothetical protein